MKYFQPFPGKSNNYEKDDPSHSKISHIPDYHDSHDSQTGSLILLKYIKMDFDFSIVVETVHTGSVVVSVFITMLVISFLGWIGYAYFNPNTSSGRFLIKVQLRRPLRSLSLITKSFSVSARGLEVEAKRGPLHRGLHSHVRLVT